MATKQPSSFGTKKANIELPGNTDSISAVLGAALFGESGIQDAGKLASESKKHNSLSENIAELVTGANSIIQNVKDIQTSLTTLSTTFKTTVSDSSLKMNEMYQAGNTVLAELLANNSSLLSGIDEKQQLQNLGIGLLNDVINTVAVNNEKFNTENINALQNLIVNNKESFNQINSLFNTGLASLNDILFNSQSMTDVLTSIKTFTEAFSEIGNIITNILGDLELNLDGISLDMKDIVPNLIEALMSSLGTLLENGLQMFGGKLGKLGATAEKVVSVVGTMSDTVGDKIGDISETIATNSDKLTETVSGNIFEMNKAIDEISISVGEAAMSTALQAGVTAALNATGVGAAIVDNPIGQAILGTICDFITSLPSKIINFIDNLVDTALNGLINFLADKLGLDKQTIEGLRNTIGFIADNVKVTLQQVLFPFLGYFKAFGRAVFKAYEYIKSTGIIDAIKGIAKTVVEIFSQIGELLKPIQDIYNVLCPFADFGKTAHNLEQMTSEMVSEQQHTLDAICGLSSNLSDVNNSIIESNGQNKDLILNTSAEIATATRSSISDAMKQHSENVAASLESINGIKECIETNIKTVKEAIEPLLGVITSLNGVLQEYFTQFFEYLKTTVETISNAVKPIVEQLKNSFEKVNEVVNIIKDNIKTVIDTISSINNIITDLCASVIKPFVSAYTAIAEWYTNTYQPIMIKASEQIGQVVTFVQTLVSKVEEIVNTFLLRKTQDKGEDGEPVKGVVDIVVSGADKDTMKQLKDLADVKLTKESLLSVESLDAYEGYYKKLDEVFKLQATCGKSAEAASKSSGKIKSALDKSKDVAIKANESSDEIKEAMDALHSIASFIFKAGLTLMLGALFMKIPGIFKNAIEFTIALTLFITATLGVVMIIDALANRLGGEKEVATNFASIGSFLFKAAFTLLIGSLIAMIPNIEKNALKFTVILTVFLSAILIPISIAERIAGEKGIGAMEGVKSLIITSTIIMSIGALFVMLGGGKFMVGALTFGFLLATFIGLILLPILLYNKFSGDAHKSLKDIKSLIVTCTFIMALGALFMMSDTLVINALAFGFLLSAFITIVLGPILLYNILSPLANKSIRDVQRLIVACSVIMLIGAFFMMSNKLVVGALSFAFLIGTFIAIVLAPILLFTIYSKKAMRNLKQISALIFVCTVTMLIGAFFMQKWEWVVGALAFGFLIGAFIGIVLGAVSIISKKGGLEKDIKNLGQLSLLILVCTVSIALGAYIVNEYGWGAVGGAAIIAAFVAAMIGVCYLVTRNDKKISSALFGFKNLGIGIGIIALAIAGVTIIGVKFGWGNVVGGTVVLGIFVAAMIGLFNLVTKNDKTIYRGMEDFVTMGKGIAVLSGAIGIMAGIGYLFGWGNVVGGALVLGVFVWGMIALFKGVEANEKPMTKGLRQFKVMSIAIGILAAAIGIMTGIGYIFGWGNVLVGAVTLGVFVWGMIALFKGVNASANDIDKGMAAFKTMSIAIAILAAAIGITAFIISEYEWAVVGAAVVLGGFTWAMITLLNQVGNSNNDIVKGTMGLLLLSAAVTVLSVAIGITAWLIDNYEWAVVGAAAILLIFVGGLIGICYLAASQLPAIAAGGSGLLLLSAAVLVLSVAIGLTAMILDTYGAKMIVGAGVTLLAFIVACGVLFAAAIPVGISATIALPGIALMTGAVLALSLLILTMGIAIQEFRKGVEGYDISNIKTAISQFIGISDAAPGLMAFVKITSKLGRLRTLAYIMCDVTKIMANAVKAFAELRVPTKWDAEGNPIKFRNLTFKDFETAANSVKYTLTTLASAITETYDNNPKLFGRNAENILYRIKRLTLTEQFILETLCEGIKSYAQLMIPTKWNNEGKPIKFRTMKQEDFKAAADGVSIVMTTLAAAMAKTYEDNKTWLFDSGHFGKILSQIERLSLAEARILSRLSWGLQSYAQILIPTKWNKDGDPIKFRQMTNQEFVDAATNIGAVMTTMAYAIKSVWDGKGFDITVNGSKVSISGPGEGKGLGWMSFLVGAIANSMTPLGELISSLASGLQSYAELKIATEWNSKGKPTKFENMTSEHFTKAADNIAKVITTLATAVSTAYDTLMPNGVWSKWFGTPPDEKIKLLMPLGELVSSLASGLLDYAELKIPTAWNSKGKPIAFKQMEGGKDGDFAKAGTNIETVITTLATAVHKAWKTLPGDADDIKELIEAITPMGDLISSMAEGLQNYANLKMPIGFDSRGRATGYVQFTSDDFGNAATNIGLVLSTLSNVIDKVWRGGKLTLGTKTIEFGKGLSDTFDADDFKEIMESFGAMGSMVSDIASGLQSYAKLMIPTYGADGKITSARPFLENDFTKAGKNIARVIMGVLVGDADVTADIDTEDIRSGVIGAYNLLSDLNIEDELGEILDSLGGVGTFIGNMSEGLAKYAELKVATDWNSEGKPTQFMTMNETMFASAGKNIVKVLTTLLFGDNMDKPTGGIVGAYTILEELSLEEMLPEIMEQFNPVSDFIGTMAEGISKMAQLLIPTEWNNEGKAIKYIPLTDDDFNTAGTNIAKILTTMVNTIIQIVKDNPETFSDENNEVKVAIESTMNIGKLMKNIAEGIQTFAGGGIPIYNSEGKVIGYKKIGQTEYDAMTATIGSILSAMVDTIIEEGLKIDEQMTGEEFTTAIDNVSKIGNLIKNIAEGIQAYANMKIPLGWDKEGKATGYRPFNDGDRITAKANIKNIIISLASALSEVYESTLDDKTTKYKDFITGTYVSDINSNIKECASVISNVAKVVENYSKMKIVTGFDKDGKPNAFVTLDAENAISNMTSNIKELLTSIPNAFYMAWSEKQSTLFNADFVKNLSSVYNTIEYVSNLCNPLFTIVKKFADNAEVLQNYFKYNDGFGTPKDKLQGILLGIYNILSGILVTYADIVKLTTTETSPDKICEAIYNFETFANALVNTINNVLVPNTDVIKSIISTDNTVKVLRNINTVSSELIAVAQTIGNTDNNEAFNNLSNINSGITTLSSVLNNIIENIIKPLNQHGAEIEKIFEFGSKSLVTKESKSIFGIFKTKQKSVEFKIGLFADILNIVKDITTFSNELSSFEIENNEMTEALTNSILTVVEIIAALMGENNDGVLPMLNTFESSSKLTSINKSALNQKHGYEIGIFNDIAAIIKDSVKLAKYINKYIEEVELDENVYTQTPIDIVNDIIESIVESFDGIDDYNALFTKLFVKPINAESTDKFKIGLFGDIKTIFDDIYNFSQTIQTPDDDFNKSLFSIYNAINNLYSYVLNGQISDKFMLPLYSMTETIKLFYGYTAIRENNEGFITGLVSDVYGIIKDIDTLTSLVNKSSNITDDNFSSLGEGLTVLGDGLVCILQALSDFEYKEDFTKATNQIDKFIKNTVNKIDVEKIDRLISLTTSLNNLADKTTNLDELTKAIAEDLTLALDALTQRMDESKRVIQLSEDIQNKRHKIIASVISEMRSIMNKPIDVKISVDENASQESTPDGGGNGDAAPKITEKSTQNKQGKPIGTGGESGTPAQEGSGGGSAVSGNAVGNKSTNKGISQKPVDMKSVNSKLDQIHTTLTALVSELDSKNNKNNNSYR